MRGELLHAIQARKGKKAEHEHAEPERAGIEAETAAQETIAQKDVKRETPRKKKKEGVKMTTTYRRRPKAHEMTLGMTLRRCRRWNKAKRNPT